MQRVPARSRSRAKRPDILGVTSDGVPIPRPPRGRGNLSAAQIQKIVDGLVRATKPQLDAAEARRQKLLEPLAPLERRVAGILADGYSDEDAVRTLGVTEGDFEQSRRKVMSRLGVHDGGELATMLFGRRPTTAE